MKRRTFALFVVMAMGALTACGDKDNTTAVSSSTVEQIKDYTEEHGIGTTRLSWKTIHPSWETGLAEDESIMETETTVEEETVEDEVVVEDDTDVDKEVVTGGNAGTNDKVVTEKTEPAKTESNSNTAPKDTAPAQSEPANSNSVEPAQPAPAPKPAHTHNWIEHTTTGQVWVPHIVVVDDYEYRVIGRTDDVAICDCGFTTSDSSVMESHIVNHILAHEDAGFTIQAGHDIVEQVKVGSHEEDYGHYETQTYVDYYYCECGERK